MLYVLLPCLHAQVATTTRAYASWSGLWSSCDSVATRRFLCNNSRVFLPHLDTKTKTNKQKIKPLSLNHSVIDRRAPLADKRCVDPSQRAVWASSTAEITIVECASWRAA